MISTVAYTIEFQKRGLPHAHIVVWLAESDRCHSTEDIDFLVSAEIPNKDDDPLGFEAVTSFMIHGPCGTVNPNCACMIDVNGQKRCSKFFPKEFAMQTTIDQNGYPIYKRRDDGRTVTCRGVEIDNRYQLYIA